MTILEIESEWRQTKIDCPRCGGYLYTDGKHAPTCGDESCLCEPPAEYIWEWLITLPLYRVQLAREWSKKIEETP